MDRNWGLKTLFKHFIYICIYYLIDPCFVNSKYVYPNHLYAHFRN